MIVISDQIPQIDSPEQYQAAVVRAAWLFKQQGMKDAAKFAAGVHERAVDYLEQAPVLALAVLAGGGKLNGGQRNRAYAAHKLGGLCRDGAKLRDVMAAYGLPTVLRKLKAKALCLDDEAAIRDIAALNPSTISQIIPSSVAKQRIWLSAIGAWRYRARWRNQGVFPCPPWAIVQIAKHGIRPAAVDEVADFHLRGDVKINPCWEWPRAVAAAEDWHDRMSAGDAKTKFGIMADQVIDLGNHPNHAVISDLEFIALRTPLAIHAEGVSMHHCVSSYVSSVLGGFCHIVSIRQDERRIATMELVDGQIRQLKGRFNAQVPPHVWSAARDYAAEQRKARA
ncbi:PcfJ domain-containing protein [Sphingomonas sp. Marseille-Q8236]